MLRANNFIRETLSKKLGQERFRATLIGNFKGKVKT